MGYSTQVIEDSLKQQKYDDVMGVYLLLNTRPKPEVSEICMQNIHWSFTANLETIVGRQQKIWPGIRLMLFMNGLQWLSSVHEHNGIVLLLSSGLNIAA